MLPLLQIIGLYNLLEVDLAYWSEDCLFSEKKANDNTQAYTSLDLTSN